MPYCVYNTLIIIMLKNIRGSRDLSQGGLALLKIARGLPRARAAKRREGGGALLMMGVCGVSPRKF